MSGPVMHEKMRTTNQQKEATEYLYDALNADNSAEKQVHIRHAFQQLGISTLDN